ncbi:MAG: Flp pilus assembly complex ATPase component [Nitrospirae bacterium]|nr:Flp pilus assembly complex ATPase component [Nitrospirota bacterium]
MKKESESFPGKIFVENNIVTREELDIGIREQQRRDSRYLGLTLVKLGFAAEEEILPILAEQLSVPYVKVKDKDIDPSVIEKVPAKVVYHYKVMPLEMKNGILTMAVTDPLAVHVLDDIRLLLGCEIKPVLGGEKDILEGLNKYYGIGAETVEGMIDETGLAKVKESSLSETVPEDIEDLAEDASIIRFVNQILLQAFHDRATDIHIEPFEDELQVRYRIDGVLYETSIPPTIKHFQAAIISRIKIMAKLDIAERRLPQDGRIKVKVGEEELDLRVSILPTPHGESVNIRLLSSRYMLLGLKNLGLSDKDITILELMIKKPHGIILVTGPTGSGKTTTLYACLSKINNNEKKIITIEDPIEYQLKGITQIQILPKIDLTFSRGLRSMLRHDPDVMMVGEVRDYETAEITIRVALTGHLVFSTLHTNDAAGAVTRLLDMSIEPYLISSSVECIIAQRLVRLICPDCKHEVKQKKELIEEMGFTKEILETEAIIFEGKGCEKCKFTGYRGRTGIYEFLVMNDEIRQLVLERTPANIIKEKAISLGMRTLRQDGWEKVRKGLTTASEVVRVTQQEDIME